MADEGFLTEAQENLAELLKPYQQELSRREKMAEFVKRCIQLAGKDDFLQLDELLKSAAVEDVEAEDV